MNIITKVCLLRLMCGSRGTPKPFEGVLIHYSTALHSKVHSPPYCVDILLDPCMWLDKKSLSYIGCYTSYTVIGMFRSFYQILTRRVVRFL